MSDQVRAAAERAILDLRDASEPHLPTRIDMVVAALRAALSAPAARSEEADTCKACDGTKWVYPSSAAPDAYINGTRGHPCYSCPPEPTGDEAAREQAVEVHDA